MMLHTNYVTQVLDVKLDICYLLFCILYRLPLGAIIFMMTINKIKIKKIYISLPWNDNRSRHNILHIS